MPEMMGVALLIDTLSKNRNRPHEFEELRDRSRRLGTRLAAAIERVRLRWMR